MNFLLSTLIGVIVIETSFFVAELIIKRRGVFSGFITTFILGFIVLGFTFGNIVRMIFDHIAKQGNTFYFFDILLVFFNMFYGFFRGTGRIASLSKKYGNL